jgi:hypothetical protein
MKSWGWTRCVIACGWAAVLATTTTALGCSSSGSGPAVVAPPRPIAPAAPPKDDGKASEGGGGGDAHAAALEQLKTAPIGLRGDKQGSVRVPLPDSRTWTRVKFWGVKSLVGFRYGKEHHAVVGALVTHVDLPADPKAPGVCRAAFDDWAKPMLKTYDAPDAFVWKDGRLVEVTSVTARMATVLSSETYLVSYAAFPVPEWNNGCLVVGIAVPARNETERARAVRDRWVKEGLPRLQVTSRTDPPERF